jgi:hypothetical protein
MFGMSWMAPPDIETCVICGEPLTGRPYLMVDYPNAAHVTCSTQNSIQQVVQEDLPRLRRAYLELKSLLVEIESIGKWLAEIGHKGNGGESSAVVGYQKRRAGLVGRLEKLAGHLPYSCRS